MHHLISRYLFLHRQAALPGVGTFTIVSQNAAADVALKQVEAPGWNILFKEVHSSITDEFIQWLSVQLQVSKEQATAQFEAFIQDVVAALQNNQAVVFEEVGVLKKRAGTVEFTPASPTVQLFTNVVAEKVMRENINHPVLVGAHERSAVEMQERLNRQESSGWKRSTIIALVLLLLALLALGVVWYKNGYSLSHMGNQQKVEATQPADTYKLR